MFVTVLMGFDYNSCWNSVYGESRMYGVEVGKSRRLFQRLTYTYHGVDMTMKTYSHLNEDMIVRAAKTIDKIF